MLNEQFTKVFALFRPGVVASFQAELTLLLDFLVFWFSVRLGKPLPGMALMNLRYRDERAILQIPPLALSTSHQPAASLLDAPSHGTSRGGAGAAAGSAAAAATSPTSLSAAVGGLGGGDRDGGAAVGPVIGGGRTGVEGPGLTAGQRGLYCLGAVLLKYGWARLTHHAAARHWGDVRDGGWRRSAWTLLRRAESGYRLAALLNFLAFLRTGKYRSLLERLLRARLVYGNPSAARAISFEYLNRQLVWSELSELLLFLLPLLDVAALKRAVRAHLPRIPALSGGASGVAAAAAKSGGGAQGEVQPCGICGEADPPSPWSALPCLHRFCYYCLRSHCQADPSYTCPLCLERVQAMQRWWGGATGKGASSPALLDPRKEP